MPFAYSSKFLTDSVSFMIFSNYVSSPGFNISTFLYIIYPINKHKIKQLNISNAQI